MSIAQNSSPQTAGDCLLFATADWDTPYWTNKQHTADHLVKAGWRVLYIESIGLRAPKLGSGTDWGRIMRRLWRGLKGPQHIREGLWVLSPLVIPFKHAHPWIRALNQGLLSWTISRFTKQQRFQSPLIWTYHPYVLEVLDLLKSRHQQPLGRLVYHCVDDLSAIPGINAEAFSAEERRLLALADATFTTSKTLYAKCNKISERVHNFPNVVDVQHFSRAHDPGDLPSDLSDIPPPRIGYAGALSDFKVDFSLLKEVASQNPQWSFVIIGEEIEGQRDSTLKAMVLLPNVHLLGHKPYSVLPEYFRGFSVGLLPTKVNEYTRSMFPMKFFEYIAAGLPVVSTSLEFTKANTESITIADSTLDFTNAIQSSLDSGKLSKMRGNKIVGENTWGNRLGKMLEIVNQEKQAKISP
ncbi:glycosyltransferase [Hydrogenophaga sp. PAMC20947]|uniref:glycosyltransferase n=1 Tax=Hydrogenophaga sp. PAMC20947 TaxID=2565558 RepID=UPI00109DCFA7|nr:glycosyltransferase [Hydrogenophaga sp. PAMC20947]QCB46336.1 glycosyltransferase family 1 protein [Hydrogenophaga sp. PAMC20947]